MAVGSTNTRLLGILCGRLQKGTEKATAEAEAGVVDEEDAAEEVVGGVAFVVAVVVATGIVTVVTGEGTEVGGEEEEEEEELAMHSRRASAVVATPAASRTRRSRHTLRQRGQLGQFACQPSDLRCTSAVGNQLQSTKSRNVNGLGKQQGQRRGWARGAKTRARYYVVFAIKLEKSIPAHVSAF